MLMSPYSPTNSATSTTSSEQHHYQQPRPQSAATQGATSEAYHHLQDAAHQQAPINSRRQDSAISHYRLETSKDSSSFTPPSESDFSYPHQSPKDSFRQDSPRLTSHYTPQSSNSSLTAHLPATSPRLHEHVTPACAASVAASASDPSPRSAALPLPPDHVSPVTRQQRYNVRFVTNYTSTNMPPTQRPRPSPPLPAIMAPAEPVQSPPVSRVEHVAPRAEQLTPRADRMPIPDARAMILGQGHKRLEVPSQAGAERCPGCHEAYSPPLPTAWRQQPPAKDAMDYAKATAELLARNRENEKIAEDDYERWKQKHASCPVKTPSDLGHDPHHLPINGITHGLSNKRKSEQAHDDMTRSRRYPFDSHSTTAPPVRPTAPI